MTYQRTTQVVRLSDIIIRKYQPLFNDIEHSDQIVTSGRAGAKSSFAGIKEIYMISTSSCAVVVMRKHHNKLRKTVYQECIRAINRLGLKKSDFKITVSPMQITHKQTGSTIYFAGSDSVDDTKGIIDPFNPIKLVVIDELTEFFDDGDGEDELEQIKATFVRGNDDYFTTMYLFNPPKNPKAPIMQWLNKVKLRPDVTHIHADYRDVPEHWLGRMLIKAAELMREFDIKMYEWVWLGLCTGLEDLIYYMFDEEKHVREYNFETDGQLTLIGIGIDYGQMNATTYQAFGLSMIHKRLFGLGEYYHSGRDSGKQKSPSEYAKDFVEFVTEIELKTNQSVVFAVIDPSAKGLKEEIKRLIPRVKLVEADNRVNVGINRVQKLLSFNLLTLSREQKNAISEMYLYSYDEKSIERGIEKPVKLNDHAQDAIRYLVMYLWRYIGKVLPYLRDKEDKEDENVD